MDWISVSDLNEESESAASEEEEEEMNVSSRQQERSIYRRSSSHLSVSVEPKSLSMESIIKAGRSPRSPAMFFKRQRA